MSNSIIFINGLPQFNNTTVNYGNLEKFIGNYPENFIPKFVNGIVELILNCSSSSSTNLNIDIPTNLTSNISSTSSTNLDLDMLIDLTNNISSTSSTNLDLDMLIDLTNNISSTSSTSLNLSMLIDLINNISSTSSTNLDLSITVDLTNNISSSSSTNLDLNLLVEFIGNCESSSIVNLNLLAEALELLINSASSTRTTLLITEVINPLYLKDGELTVSNNNMLNCGGISTTVDIVTLTGTISLEIISGVITNVTYS